MPGHSNEMAEIIAYLAANLGGVRVSSEVPANMPSQLVTVARVGGEGSMMVDMPRVDVDAWSTSDASARALSDEAVRLMFALPGSSQLVSNVSKMGQYRSDVDGRHRWTSTFSIVRNV